MEMVAEGKVDAARERGWDEVAEGVVAEVAEKEVASVMEVVPRGKEVAKEDVVEVGDVALVAEEAEGKGRTERNGCRERRRESGKEGQGRTKRRRERGERREKEGEAKCKEETKKCDRYKRKERETRGEKEIKVEMRRERAGVFSGPHEESADWQLSDDFKRYPFR